MKSRAAIAFTLLLLGLVGVVLVQRETQSSDNAVYSAYFIAELTENPISSDFKIGPNGAMLQDSTVVLPPESENRIAQLKRDMARLDPSTVLDLLRKNRVQNKLQNSFGVPVEFVSEAHLKPEKLPELPRDRNGVVRVSRIGFNWSRTQALFYVEHIGCALCGGAKYVLMHRNLIGRWRIQSQHSLWIS